MDLAITDFLWLRVTKDREIAQQPTHATWAEPRWTFHPGQDGRHAYVDLGTNHLGAESSLNDAELRHIARNDPARATANAELLEWLLREHKLRLTDAGEFVCPVDGEDCATLKRMALLYADHPDYRPEWRP